MKLIAIAAASAMLVAGASASPDPPGTTGTSYGELGLHHAEDDFNVSPKMYAGVDYMRCFKKDDTKIDGFTIGLGYRF